MSGGSFESSQRTEPVCATRFSSIKNCFKTQASGLARGRGWSRIGQCVGRARGVASAFRFALWLLLAFALLIGFCDLPCPAPCAAPGRADRKTRKTECTVA